MGNSIDESHFYSISLLWFRSVDQQWIEYYQEQLVRFFLSNPDNSCCFQFPVLMTLQQGAGGGHFGDNLGPIMQLTSRSSKQALLNILGWPNINRNFHVFFKNLSFSIYFRILSLIIMISYTFMSVYVIDSIQFCNESSSDFDWSNVSKEINHSNSKKSLQFLNIKVCATKFCFSAKF